MGWAAVGKWILRAIAPALLKKAGSVVAKKSQ